jgi:hypothetical protein
MLMLGNVAGTMSTSSPDIGAEVVKRFEGPADSRGGSHRAHGKPALPASLPFTTRLVREVLFCRRATLKPRQLTVNIHSHLFGGSLFFALPFYAFYQVYPRQPTATGADVLVFAAFFYGVSICYFLSSMLGAFTRCHNPK